MVILASRFASDLCYAYVIPCPKATWPLRVAHGGVIVGSYRIPAVASWPAHSRYYFSHGAPEREVRRNFSRECGKVYSIDALHCSG